MTESRFEITVDAVVTGNVAELRRLLAEEPTLVKARSARAHRATLLNYVGANGVEEERQKTPPNVLEVAKILLAAGAEVDAEANLYGGECTTLGLAATSVHPWRAGLQNELLQLLLDHGADIDYPRKAGGTEHSIVIGCLENGRGSAATFLASRGARLDLEAAAGSGRIDGVRKFVSEDGTLREGATAKQRQRGFLWACEYGHREVVEYLLGRGADLHDMTGTDETALHWAVIGGQLELIARLLESGASLEARNGYDGTALGQALWSAVNDPAIDYFPVVQLLLKAGAKVEPGAAEWLEQQSGG